MAERAEAEQVVEQDPGMPAERRALGERAADDDGDTSRSTARSALRPLGASVGS